MTTETLTRAEISRPMLVQIRKDLDDALVQIAVRYRLRSFKAAKCVYDSQAGCFNFKVEAVMDGGASPEEVRYDAMCKWTKGLPARGTAFKFAGAEYAIIGANTTGSKIKAHHLHAPGKVYLFTPDQIVRFTAASPAGA